MLATAAVGSSLEQTPSASVRKPPHLKARQRSPRLFDCLQSWLYDRLQHGLQPELYERLRDRLQSR